MAKQQKSAGNVFPLPNDNITNDAQSLLNEMTNSAPSKSKSKVPIIVDPEFEAKVDKVIELNEAYKDAESKYKLAAEEVINRAREDYDKRKGNQPSFNVQGSNKGVLVSFKNQFKEIPITSKEDLQKICGKDYDKYFKNVYEIRMKDTRITKIQELMDIIGAERFKELFEIKKSFVAVVDDMNVLQYELPDGAKAFVNQYKGSVKV